MKQSLILTGLLIIISQQSISQGFYNDGTSKTMQDIIKADCCLLGQYKISGSFGSFFNKITYQNADSKYIDYNRYGFNFNINAKFYKEFQLRLSLYADLNNEENKPEWLSNFYYSIGNYNWQNKTFSYGYENYQPNRFDGSYDLFENMKRGFFFLNFNYYVLTDNNKLKIDGTSQIYISPFIRYQPEYTDRYGIEILGNHKFVIGSSIRYVILRNIYVEGAVYFYPKSESKLPWDPDYTYGFGIFNWKSFKINMAYGNWIANRFPWNEKEMKNDFSNGEFKIVLSYIW